MFNRDWEYVSTNGEARVYHVRALVTEYDRQEGKLTVRVEWHDRSTWYSVAVPENNAQPTKAQPIRVQIETKTTDAIGCVNQGSKVTAVEIRPGEWLRIVA